MFRSCYLVNLLLILKGCLVQLQDYPIYGKEEPTKKEPPTCDQTNVVIERDDNFGQKPSFPWLGVLKVTVQHRDRNVAVTGIILIKIRFALGSADDIARIPKRMFAKNARAMFVLEDNVPVHCAVKDYFFHPEYQYINSNTIALVQLDEDDEALFRLVPVCWKVATHMNASGALYALGYTDENKHFEKFIYKLRYIDRIQCDRFYNRTGIHSLKKPPSDYVCASTSNNRESCVWDNGMAMGTNVSGYWILLGLGVHGPGCASPSRFINLAPYLDWIDTTTSNLQSYYDKYSRRSFNKSGVEDIPVHKLFVNGRRQSLFNLLEIAPPGKPIVHDSYNTTLYKIDRLARNEISIQFYNKYQAFPGSCKIATTPVYVENMIVYSESEEFSSVDYMVSVMDLQVQNYTCAYLKVTTKNDDLTENIPGYLWYRDELNAVNEFLETPGDVLKVKPFSAGKTTKRPAFLPATGVFKPVHIRDDRPIKNGSTLNMFITIKFKFEATLYYSVYGVQNFGANMPGWQWGNKTSRRFRKIYESRPVFSRFVRTSSASISIRNFILLIVLCGITNANYALLILPNLSSIV